MTTLGKEEIIAQLKRLGIHNSSEHNVYLQEYLRYFTFHHDSTASRFRLLLNEDMRTKN